MKIIWNNDIEPQNKKEIEKYLNDFLWLIPKWCQHVFIGLYDSKGSSAVSTTVNYEYRRVTIDFWSCWLTQSPEMKRDNVIHEFIHFNVNHLYNEARGIVTNCVEGDKLKDYAFEQLRMAVESVTQDLTHAIMNKFNA